MDGAAEKYRNALAWLTYIKSVNRIREFDVMVLTTAANNVQRTRKLFHREFEQAFRTGNVSYVDSNINIVSFGLIIKLAQDDKNGLSKFLLDHVPSWAVENWRRRNQKDSTYSAETIKQMISNIKKMEPDEVLQLQPEMAMTHLGIWSVWDDLAMAKNLWSRAEANLLSLEFFCDILATRIIEKNAAAVVAMLTVNSIPVEMLRTVLDNIKVSQLNSDVLREISLKLPRYKTTINPFLHVLA